MSSTPPLAEWMLALTYGGMFLALWKVLLRPLKTKVRVWLLALATVPVLVWAVGWNAAIEGLLFTAAALVVIAVVIFTGHWLLSKALGVPFDPLGRRQ